MPRRRKTRPVSDNAVWSSCYCDLHWEEGGDTCLLQECQDTIFKAGGSLPCLMDYNSLWMEPAKYKGKNLHVRLPQERRCIDCGAPIKEDELKCPVCVKVAGEKIL